VDGQTLLPSMELRERLRHIRWRQKSLTASLWQSSTFIMQGSKTHQILSLLLICTRGPEVEFWLGGPDGVDPAKENDWSLLPFMALSDGAHTWAQGLPLPILIAHSKIGQRKSSLILHSCEKRQINCLRHHCSAYHAQGRYLQAS
jgi:Transport protein Avl9